MHGRQGGSDYVLSSQTEKLMAGTKFSDYLGLNHYKQARKGFRPPSASQIFLGSL